MKTDIISIIAKPNRTETRQQKSNCNTSKKKKNSINIYEVYFV